MKHATDYLWFETPNSRDLTESLIDFGTSPTSRQSVVWGNLPVPPDPLNWSACADRPLRGREQVFYAEFDGRRRKRVVLKAIGE
jgi:hypothetical protein